MKTRLAVLAVLVLSFAAITGCGTTAKLTSLGEYDVIQVSQTNAFGHDNSGFVVLQKQAPIQTVVTAPAPRVPRVAHQAPRKLTKSYTKSATSWTGCKDKTPNKRARNIRREEVEEKWTEEVPASTHHKVIVQQAPAPAQIFVQQQPAIPVLAYGGGNPSAGNMVLPSVFMAAGMVGAASALRPSETNINQVGGGAYQSQGQIQSQRMWQRQTATGGNANANSSTNTDVGVRIRN